MIQTPGAQCVCNPPLELRGKVPMYLAEPQECESWLAAEDRLEQDNLVVYPVQRSELFSGFYMAPMADLGSKGQLNALGNITSWGMMYIRTVYEPVQLRLEMWFGLDSVWTAERLCLSLR